MTAKGAWILGCDSDSDAKFIYFKGALLFWIALPSRAQAQAVMARGPLAGPSCH